MHVTPYLHRMHSRCRLPVLVRTVAHSLSHRYWPEKREAPYSRLLPANTADTPRWRTHNQDSRVDPQPGAKDSVCNKQGRSTAWARAVTRRSHYAPSGRTGNGRNGARNALGASRLRCYPMRAAAVSRQPTANAAASRERACVVHTWWLAPYHMRHAPQDPRHVHKRVHPMHHRWLASNRSFRTCLHQCVRTTAVRYSS